MSSLASTQVPKPQDEQAFERANVVLWRHLLNDPNVQRNGRRGQRQNGVDLFGVRNGNPAHHVGIQCKLKSHDQELTEGEIRIEIRKALTFTPPLREYFIVTTSADDVALQELVRNISTTLHSEGRTMAIFVWGWNTLEERIAEHSEARKAFDPTFTPHSEETLGAVRQVMACQGGMAAEMTAGFSRLESQLTQLTQNLRPSPSDATGSGSVLEAHLDAEIDSYRSLLNEGQSKTALQLLTKFLSRVGDQVSGRIIFRVKANIGACHLALGAVSTAADLLSEAYQHAPTEPKAIANQAYALLLREQWQEAFRFAKNGLDAAPDNEALAGYLIQAAIHDPEIQQPLSLVPTALHESSSVMIAVTHFLRQRKRSPDWYEAARFAAKLHPEDKQIQLLSAEASLDEIAGDEAQKEGGKQTAEQRAHAFSAIDIFTAEWKRAQLSEGEIWEMPAGICCNLIVAHRMVGDLPAALEVARQGRAAAPLNVDIARRAVVVAMESGDIEMAGAALAILPADAETTALAVGVNASNGDWQRVADLCAEIPDGLTENDRVNLTTLGRVAAIKLAPATARRSLLESLVADTSESLNASLIVIQATRSENAEDLCDNVYARLLQQIGASTHRAERYGVAHHAAMRFDWSTVADLLDGQVPEDRDSDELRLLARAYVNERPMRERGIRFFERLPKELHERAFYVEAIALFHFNRGDLPVAETTLRAAIQVAATTQSHLSLISTLRRRGKSEEVEALLSGLNIESLVGPPADRIAIAAELNALGRGSDAIRISYQVLRSAKNDPDAALRYVGLVMSDADVQLIPMPEVIAEDCWVRLDSPDSSAAQSFLITKGIDRPADGEFGLNHPMVLKSLGLKVGDTFQLDPGPGQRVTWRVAEIKHKYLHALHEVMENFEAWHPNTPGLWKYSLKDDGDVTPLLDQIKAFAEKDRLLADLYLVKHAPLGMVSVRAGRDCLGFAEYIRSLGKTIVACIGTDSERAAAHELILRHRQSTLVMDTYTSWVVASADLLDVLTTMFAGLAIPQSTIDEFVTLRSKHSVGRGEAMTISWRNGQFVRQDILEEDVVRQQGYIDEQIKKLEDLCQVVPVVAPDLMSDPAKVITSGFGTHILDAAFLSHQKSGLLLSEDMYFRNTANAAIPISSVWLQPVLLAALREGLIDHTRYTKALIHLAARGHGHLSVGSDDLLAIFEQDETEHLWSFSSVVEHFGVPGSEMESHVTVSQRFLHAIWQWDDDSSLKRGRATGTLLRSLVRNRSVEWESVLVYLYRAGNAEFRSYVERWIVGHMFSISQFWAALEKVTHQRARK